MHECENAGMKDTLWFIYYLVLEFQVVCKLYQQRDRFRHIFYRIITCH